MANDKKDTDEYQYPSDEYYKGRDYPSDESLDPLEEEELAPPAERRGGISRRILLALGFLVAIGVVYLILTFRATQHVSQEPATPVVTTVTATKPAAAPVKVVTRSAPIMQNTAPNAQMQGLIEQNGANQQTIAGMQTQIQQLQAQVEQLTNSLSTINNNMQIIANEIRAITLDKALSNKQIGPNKMATLYYLKAMIPGRAWLQSNKGMLTTVTVGDKLPGYGLIQMINTNQGIVTTSSGAVIEYGAKEQ